jgi:hypothetical protein
LLLLPSNRPLLDLPDEQADNPTNDALHVFHVQTNQIITIRRFAARSCYQTSRSDTRTGRQTSSARQISSVKGIKASQAGIHSDARK